MPWTASEIFSMTSHWNTGLLNKSRQLSDRYSHAQTHKRMFFVNCRCLFFLFSFGRTGSQAWRAAFWTWPLASLVQSNRTWTSALRWKTTSRTLKPPWGADAHTCYTKLRGKRKKSPISNEVSMLWNCSTVHKHCVICKTLAWAFRLGLNIWTCHFTNDSAARE